MSCHYPGFSIDYQDWVFFMTRILFYVRIIISEQATLPCSCLSLLYNLIIYIHTYSMNENTLNNQIFETATSMKRFGASNFWFFRPGTEATGGQCICIGRWRLSRSKSSWDGVRMLGGWQFIHFYHTVDGSEIPNNQKWNDLKPCKWCRISAPSTVFWLTAMFLFMVNWWFGIRIGVPP